MKIPDDFILGAGTSAFQVEGATREDGRGPSIWDGFEGETGQTGEVASDHYHRYREDVALMADLGLDAYRFSIAWPRIFPTGKGKPNPKGLDFYSRLVDELLARNIEPWPTLYHWDLPAALQEEGGWENRETSERFADYTQTVLESLSDRVERWCTINEPWSATALGYQAGQHAPFLKKSAQTAIRVIHHFYLAHGLALERIRQRDPRLKAGIVLNPWIPLPLSYREEDLQAARAAWDKQVAWWFGPIYEGKYPEVNHKGVSLTFDHVQEGDLDRISARTDFLGLNMYYPGFVRASRTEDAAFEDYEALVNLPRSEMGWLSYPPGLSFLLTEVNHRYKPAEIYVTENGCADPDLLSDDGEIHDLFRQEYLRSHLLETLRAREEGVPVKGYFAWSLLDNYEWQKGYEKRFGLVYVDFKTLERKLKFSAEWYRRVARARRIGSSSPLIDDAGI